MAGLVIDVSNNNQLVGGLNEISLRRSGAVALIAKATERDTFQDGTFSHYRRLARAAGIRFGSYLFLHPESATSQAEYYLRYAYPMVGDIQPIIDCEVTDGEPIAAVATRAAACAHLLTLRGYRPILYSDLAFLKQLLAARPELARYRIWEAQYPGRLTKSIPGLAKLRAKVGSRSSVALWQWTDRLAVDGRSYDASRLMVPLASLLIPPNSRSARVLK